MTRSVLTPARGVLMACLAAALAGCGGGGDGPKLYPVSGTVTFNGEPLKEGRIVYRMAGAGSSGRSYSGPITDGAYKLESEAGSAVVEVTAYREVPGKFDKSNGDPVPLKEMYIPPKYNRATTLKAEVKPGANADKFELTGKK
jgi:hypothetical protein